MYMMYTECIDRERINISIQKFRFGASGRGRKVFGRTRQLGLRKHRYLPHGSHFGARNGCWGLLGCCQCARRTCAGLLRCRQCARTGRSGLPRCCRCARKGCSGLLWRCQCPQNGRSRRLCFHQCAQKDCSTPFRCRQCVQSGSSRTTIRKCWSRLHCALSRCTPLCFIRAWICIFPFIA